VTAAAELILDTGPLVALLHSRDRDHARCAAVLESFRGTLFTTEPVLTECMYLLGKLAGGAAACLAFFERGGVVLVPQNRQSLTRCGELMQRYADVPMDFADATLVALAEETGVRRIFTLDRRGFQAFRPGGRGRFEIVP
jgi:predicted nucleic acid-binding protein